MADKLALTTSFVSLPNLEVHGHSQAGISSGRTVRRPVAVTFATTLAFLVSGYFVVDGVQAVARTGDRSMLAEGAFEIALGIAAIFIALGMLHMAAWAWASLMAWAAVGLAQQLVRYFFYDHPNYLGMALDTVVVFALTPLDVQIAFGVRPPRKLVLDRAARNPIDRI